MAMTPNMQLESALVGSLLVDPKKIMAAVEATNVCDFTDERAQFVFSAIVEDWKAKKPISAVSVLQRYPNLSSYVLAAVEQAFPPSVQRFSAEIAENARLRRIRTGIEAVMQEKENANNLLNGIISIYKAEMKSGNKSPEIAAILTRVENIVAKNKKHGRMGFITGINFLENLYVRYIPGHIWTIGGFTSVGKTATMVQMICNLISSGENAKILIISTEMTEEQVVARIIANLTGVHSMRILAGKFHDAEEEAAVEQVKAMLKLLPLKIYDDIYQLEEIETAFRKADLQGGINVGFIDYVQNCRHPTAKSQYQEQSEMAKRFQVLAKDTRTTLICLSQVSNDVGRGNTDQLELKGAGEWAAVSDLGVMLSRHKTEKYRLKFSVKKNRHGALDECEMEYINDFTRLVESRQRV